MKLLLDYGNSRIKWAFFCQDKLSSVHVSPHSSGGAEDIFSVLEASLSTAEQRIEKVIVASVVDEQRERALQHDVETRWKVPCVWMRSMREALGVRNAYLSFEQLGVDRFLAMIAAHQQGGGAKVLVSVGTALTVDVMTAKGAHRGGLILPSPYLMRASLQQATARITDTQGRLVVLANNTEDGVYTGSILAAVALIKKVRESATRSEGVFHELIITGGGAKDVLSFFPDASYQEHSVLQGLYHCVQRCII